MSERIDNIIRKCKKDPILLNFVEDIIAYYEDKQKLRDAEIEKEFNQYYSHNFVFWDTDIFSENLVDLSIAILGQGEFHISDSETVPLTKENLDRLYYLQDDWCKAETQMLHSMYQMLGTDLQGTILYHLRELLRVARKASSLGIPNVYYHFYLVNGLFFPLDENAVLYTPQPPRENQ